MKIAEGLRLLASARMERARPVVLADAAPPRAVPAMSMEQRAGAPDVPGKNPLRRTADRIRNLRFLRKLRHQGRAAARSLW
jgi:hypothetical protein